MENRLQIVSCSNSYISGFVHERKNKDALTQEHFLCDEKQRTRSRSNSSVSGFVCKRDTGKQLTTEEKRKNNVFYSYKNAETNTSNSIAMLLDNLNHSSCKVY